MTTFQSTLEDIDKHIQSFEWLTDKGQVVHGVLVRSGTNVILNVNSSELTEAIDFEYIYRKTSMGGRRVLYPHNLVSCKRIPKTEMSEVWPIQAFVLIDEHIASNDLINPNLVTFTYDSFVWEFPPNKKADSKKLREQLSGIWNMQTTIGTVTVDLPIRESSSRSPSVFEKRLDKITVTIEPKVQFSIRDILKWNDRIKRFFTLIHQERVVNSSIERGIDDITVPELIEDYEKAQYALRMPIFMEEFVKVVKEALPAFIDKYDEIAPFTEDLVQYYYDYPLDPPDSIQLLRLFTSLEQCANYAQRNEKILSTKLDAEQIQRKADFQILLKLAKGKQEIKDVYEYLLNTAQGFYVSSGNLSAPKYKIQALAQLLQDEYGVHNSLVELLNVEITLKMRNIVAHGFFDPESSERFYANRDYLGQDIEQSIRMYLLRALGCDKETIMRHKDPLKARQFNAQ